MSAVAALPKTRHWVYVFAPAIISVATYLIIDLIIRVFVGQPQDFWSVGGYRFTMSSSVLLRMGPVFFSAILVWPAMRGRGASFTIATIGILASPAAFAIVSGVSALTYFPPLDAAYYATNPMVMAAVGSQVSFAGIGALLQRWRAAGWRSTPSHWWSWGALIAIIVGSGVSFASVIWDGGVHVFYVWIQVYRHLISHT